MGEGGVGCRYPAGGNLVDVEFRAPGTWGAGAKQAKGHTYEPGGMPKAGEEMEEKEVKTMEM